MRVSFTCDLLREVVAPSGVRQIVGRMGILQDWWHPALDASRCAHMTRYSRVPRVQQRAVQVEMERPGYLLQVQLNLSETCFSARAADS